MKTQAGGSDQALYLPDFCTSQATLAIVLIVELTALVLTLARQSVRWISGPTWCAPRCFCCGSGLRVRDSCACCAPGWCG